MTIMLLVVFVHGFKGTDQSFGNFPQRIQHILAETVPDVTVECLVFPAYEVRPHQPIHNQPNPSLRLKATW